MKSLFHDVLLSTGSNQGNSQAILEMANATIHQNVGRLFRVSPKYKTAAWGKTNQPDFINQCLWIKTLFTPLMVLKKLNEIEKNLGRVRYERWGPRRIDIDILYYDSMELKHSDLIIPHPEIKNRNFVLAPLRDIAPQYRHPTTGLSIQELWDSRQDKSAVTPL